MSDFKLGEHEAKLSGLDDRVCRVESTVNEVNDKLDKVLDSLAERRGERKAAAYIAGLAATVVSLLLSLAEKWLVPK